ncbi:MAG: alcohol dehydrogenase catalytic domain-containing protein [Bacteroidales bacterium]
MKAMMLTGIRRMQMMEVPEPKVLSGKEVKIRMDIVGVCGSDIHYYTTGRIGSQVVRYPFPVGHEGAGTVVEIGKEVTRVKPGDRIAIEPAMPCRECDQCLAGRPHTCRKLRFLGCPGQAEGCLQEYIVMPESSCYPIPHSMTSDQAAISEPLTIGVYAVQQSVPMEGKHIGILGFGPIGMSVLLAARAEGAGKIYVTDKIDARLAIAQKCGATLTVNVNKEPATEVISRAEPLLLDAVFECCGQQDALEQAIDLLKPGGKLMIIGIPEFDRWSVPVDKTRHKEICIQNVRRQNHCLEKTLHYLSSGKIDVSLMPTHRFPFEKTNEAFDLVAGYRDGVMKAMIDF